MCSGKNPTRLHELVLKKEKSEGTSEKQNIKENHNVLGNHKDLTCPPVNMSYQVKNMKVVSVKVVHENSKRRSAHLPY